MPKNTNHTTLSAPSDPRLRKLAAMGVRWADEPDPTGTAGSPSDAGEAATGGKEDESPQKASEPLGESGIKALQSERDARKKLEGEMQTMRSAFAQALGVEVDKKASNEDVLSALQQQVADMQKDNLVNQVARETGLTDADDIALLREASSEDSMRRIASRIATPSEAPGPRAPKPDLTVGNHESTNKPDPGPGVARLAAAFEDNYSNH